MKIYHLWTFGDYNKTVITRGETQEQAYEWASKSWDRGETITCLNYNPIWAGKRYSENHADGWLFRQPEWTNKK